MNVCYCYRHTSALRNSTKQARPYSDAESPPSLKPALPGHMPEASADRTQLPRICCLTLAAAQKNLAALSFPGSTEEAGKTWGPGTMFSEELWLENEKKCAVVRKPKQGRKRQELLAVALGVKVGVKGGFLWPPLKLFACPQISSLVRRAALTHNDNHFNYEKTHNFKTETAPAARCVRVPTVHPVDLRAPAACSF
ncbi:Beta-chimaerin [Camelus dromedarius]|uniref:Beta-chimaerin n=1 Tax=Camelus dromedarius TaxID=9838 RepID=A0A5N4DZB8_CAMDR|nr:Beta-chimaerin [Camelus dromedarius]